ncbi:MAG: hypothetical protein ACRELB_23225 [Polyangiaceae bacterium]
MRLSRHLATVARFALAGTAAAVAALAAGGCILFQGGTDGYGVVSQDAGSCSGPADCNGQLCCYELQGETITASCQASCSSFQQACKAASDCQDGGECLEQSCTVDAGGSSATVAVKTCGPISFCSQ